MISVKNKYWHKKIIAYGIGREYEAWSKESFHNEFVFDALTDRKFDDGIEEYHNIPVMKTVELLNVQDAIIVVFPVNRSIYVEVQEKYESNNRNVYVYGYKEFFGDFLLRYGKDLINDITKDGTYSLDSYYFVMRYHIGDTVNLFPCISAFKILHNSPEYFGMEELSWWYSDKKIKKIIAITNKRLANLCDFCTDIDDVIVMDESELEAVNFVLHNDGCIKNIFPDEQVPFWERNPVFVGNMSLYPYRLYDLPVKNDLVYKYIDEYRLLISEKLEQETDEYIDQNGFDVNNTLVLCPHAKSTSRLETDIWNGIVQLAYEKDMRVMTNVGPNESALANTEKLSVSVNLFLALTVRGLRVIGVQSGLIDAMRRFGLQPNKSLVIWPMKNSLEKLYAYDMGVMKNDGEPYVKTINNVTYYTFDNKYFDEHVMEMIMNSVKKLLN